MPVSKRTSKREKTTKTVNRSKIRLADGLVDASLLELIQGMAQGWDVVSDAISVTEPDTNKLIYVNPAWSKLYGYSAEECLGGYITILNTEDISKKVQREAGGAVTPKRLAGALTQLLGIPVGASQALALFHWRPSPIAATIRRGYRSRSIEALPHL